MKHPNLKQPREGLNLMTLKTFLRRNQISRSTFYKLRKEGRAPKVIYIGSSVYISSREERMWLEKVSAATLAEDDDTVVAT